MQLAIVTHNVIKTDGQGRANYEIARHALKNGVGVRLIADQIEPDLLELGAEWIPVHPKAQRINLFKVWEFAARANRVIASLGNKVDVVHGYGFCLDRRHQVNTSQFVHSAWRRSPVHTSRQNHNLYGMYHWLYSALNAQWERRAYANAEVVVAASNTVRKELAEIGVPESRLRVILNGADLDLFYPGQEDRTALGLPENVPLALFTGDIKTPRKNLDTVLKALVKVPYAHLAVLGRTEGSPFPAMAEQLGIADRVHFMGFRRDVPAIMRASDLFVFPSRYEACALVLCEAIASGLPVVTAHSTGGAEVVTDECGIRLDDPNDVGAVAGAMDTLLKDPERREVMSKAARREAEEKHSWQQVAEDYLSLYREFRN